MHGVLYKMMNINKKHNNLTNKNKRHKMNQCQKMIINQKNMLKMTNMSHKMNANHSYKMSRCHKMKISVNKMNLNYKTDKVPSNHHYKKPHSNGKQQLVNNNKLLIQKMTRDAFPNNLLLKTSVSKSLRGWTVHLGKRTKKRNNILAKLKISLIIKRLNNISNLWFDVGHIKLIWTRPQHQSCLKTMIHLEASMLLKNWTPQWNLSIKNKHSNSIRTLLKYSGGDASLLVSYKDPYRIRMLETCSFINE